MRNGLAKPSDSTVTAEITGPSAKPATPADTMRPKLDPISSGLARMMIRRNAGSAAPLPIPVRKRPNNNTRKDDPNAITKQPITWAMSPSETSRRAKPLSAIGATNMLAKNPARNPDATIRPNFDSEIPYLFR